MMNKHLAILSLAALVAACDANRVATDPQASRQDAAELVGPRAVYTITNQVAGNAVLVFARATELGRRQRAMRSCAAAGCRFS